MLPVSWPPRDVNGTTELGRDIVFREESKLEDSVFCAAIVSKKNITGEIGSSTSADRILEQVRKALNELYNDPYSGRSIEIEKCWIVTFGSILPTAINSIQQQLYKTNLSKQTKFMDIRKLIGLIDRKYPGYWTETPQLSGGVLQRHDFSADKRLLVLREHSLKSATVLNENGQTVFDLPTDSGEQTDVIPIWSPDSSFLAYYNPHIGLTNILKVTGRSAAFLNRLEYNLPCLEELKTANLQHQELFRTETPIASKSRSNLVLRCTGMTQLVEDSARFLHYEYEVEIDYGDQSKIVGIHKVFVIKFRHNEAH